MATNFLYGAGTNGFLVAPFSLMTTELNTLTSTSTVISSVNGGSSNGTFTQSDTGGGVWGVISFLAGGAFTPNASNSNLTGWFILKADNSHFEKLVSNTAQPRAADFVIPLFNSAYALNDVSAAQGGISRLPAAAFEVLIQNNSGVSLPSSGNKLLLGPLSVQY